MRIIISGQVCTIWQTLEWEDGIHPRRGILGMPLPQDFVHPDPVLLVPLKLFLGAE